MSDDEFQEKWLPLEARFRAIEENYRVERIRKNGHPYPERRQLVEVENDLRAALDLYISATPEQRSVMRDLFEWSYLLPNYLTNLIYLPQGLPNEETAVKGLRTALAAASLENNKTDYRDTFVSLGSVWIAAHQRQLDPLHYFREAAEWSSVSMRRFLLDFHESEYFKSSVARN